MIDFIFDSRVNQLNSLDFPKNVRILDKAQQNSKLRILFGDLNDFGKEDIFEFEHNNLFYQDMMFEKQNLKELLDNNQEFKIYHFQNIHMKIRHLVHLMGLRLQVPVFCNLYKSFRDKEILGKHSDKTHIFVMQISGNKKWLFKDFQIELSPGDVMFVPKGVEHEVETIDSSLHLAISIHEDRPYYDSIYRKNIYKYFKNPYEESVLLNVENVSKVVLKNGMYHVVSRHDSFQMNQDSFTDKVFKGIPFKLMGDLGQFKAMKLKKIVY